MYHLITNPASHSGIHSKTDNSPEKVFEQKHIPWKLHCTSGPGDARRLAEEITSECGNDPENPLTLVIQGGDGTINEVINGIRDFRNLRVGIIPTGSGNDFARGLHLPPDPAAAVSRIVKGKVLRTIDIGRVTFNHTPEPMQRLFCVSSGIGYDASVCEELITSPLKHHLNRMHLGKLSYGIIGVRQIFTSRKAGVAIEMDDGSIFELSQMLFAAAMNEEFEGGGYRFAPDASDTDGKLNLIVIGNMPTPRALMSFPAAHAGKYYSIKGVHHFFVKSARIRTSEPMWVHTDGEVFMKTDDITVECLPGRLQLIV